MRPQSIRFRTLVVTLLLAVTTDVAPALAQAGWGSAPDTVEAIRMLTGSTAPTVAMDTAGNALAVFLDSSPMARVVVASRFAVDTNSWGPGLKLSSRPRVSEPTSGVDDAGNAFVVFTEGEDELEVLPSLRVVRYDAATRTWDLASFSADDARQVSVAVNAAGDAIVVWSDLDSLAAVRYSASTATWGPAEAVSATWAITPSVGIDADGNAHAVWSDGGRLVAARRDVTSGTWTAPTLITSANLFHWSATVGPAGHAVVTWTRPGFVEASVALPGSVTWSAPVTLSSDGEYHWDVRAAVDRSGNVTVACRHFEGAAQAWIETARYDVTTSTWSPSVPFIAAGYAYSGPTIAADPAGNVHVVWSQSVPEQYPRFQLPRLIAARYGAALGAWTTTPDLSPPGQIAARPSVAVDAAGNAITVWNQGQAPFGTLQALRWVATPAAPTVTGVTPFPGAIAVTFAMPAASDPTLAASTLEYSLDDGAIWIARTPADAASPLAISGLTDGQTYALRLRAVNAAGPGEPTSPTLVRSGTNPTNFRVTATNDTVLTFAWTPPPAGVAPTGYLLEGGITPGSTLASIPTGGTATTATFTLPAGAFFARIVALNGTQRLGTSNELAFSVGAPQVPAPPTMLLGSAVGSTLTLSWTNRFEAGTPTSVRLDVSGDLTTTLPVPLAESFSFPAVPPGTYTFSVSALNPAGPSAPSTPVTLTFPAGLTCATPQAVTGFGAGAAGALVSLAWAPPTSGAPATGYLLQVSGAFTGTLPVSERMLSIPAPPGSYTIRVAGTNACGTGPFSAPQTVGVP